MNKIFPLVSWEKYNRLLDRYHELSFEHSKLGDAFVRVTKGLKSAAALEDFASHLGIEEVQVSVHGERIEYSVKMDVDLMAEQFKTMGYEFKPIVTEQVLATEMGSAVTPAKPHWESAIKPAEPAKVVDPQPFWEDANPDVDPLESVIARRSAENEPPVEPSVQPVGHGTDEFVTVDEPGLEIDDEYNPTFDREWSEAQDGGLPDPFVDKGGRF